MKNNTTNDTNRNAKVKTRSETGTKITNMNRKSLHGTQFHEHKHEHKGSHEPSSTNTNMNTKAT